MEQGYLIGTNLVIDNLGNRLPIKAKELLNSIELIISSVTKIEVLGWPNASTEQLLPLYAFMEIVKILPIDNPIIEKTILIRQNQKIGLGDAIIAATALDNGLILITRNTSDFKNIKALTVIDPFSL